jgi:hypothetical protein
VLHAKAKRRFPCLRAAVGWDHEVPQATQTSARRELFLLVIFGNHSTHSKAPMAQHRNASTVLKVFLTCDPYFFDMLPIAQRAKIQSRGNPIVASLPYA